MVAVLYVLGDLYRDRNDAQERLEAVARRIVKDGGPNDPDGLTTERAAQAVLGIMSDLRGQPVALELPPPGPSPTALAPTLDL